MASPLEPGGPGSTACSPDGANASMRHRKVPNGGRHDVDNSLGFASHAGPWGITYASNLTPDTNTGLGILTEDMFLKAMKTGRHMGTSRPIQPPMPWPAYAQMTDDDLKAPQK